MTSGKFGVTWIVATNNLNEPVIGILGQTVSDNIGQAEDVSYADLDLTGLPIVEIRPLYKLIYETNTGYTNAVKSRLARIADIRANQAINIGIGASALSSLTDVGLTTTVANDILAYNGSNWTNTNTPTFQSATIVGGVTVDTSTFSVDAMNNRVGVLTTSPNEALDVRGNIALTGSVIFEGATADGFETILTVVDPTTADRTITLPNVTGTVITTGDTGTVTNTMLAGSISDTKLSTISTAGKVANSATTATNANTASAIVARDASGNFSAGTITTTGNVVMNNASPTAYFQDTDNRSAMIHVNGNTFYILRGDGTNSLSWATVGGAWPLTINLENNNATFGGTVTAPTFSGALSGSATYSTYLWMTGYVGTYYMSGAWTGAHWQLTTNHGSPVRVGYADSAGSAGSASGSRFDGTAFRGAGAADADSWDVQGIQSGAGNAGAAVAIWATNVAPQFRVGANNPTVYLRNADDSAYNTLEGIITNVSSAHLKQDIETFPQVPHSVGAAVNEDEILTGLNIVRQLRPVTYKWKEKEYLSQLPENPRRALALSRLNTIRKSKGLEPYDSDELHHDCSRDNCSGTADNPCQWTENWNIGNIGFISQEVGAIIPQAAILGKEGEFTGLDSLAMTALAVAAIKELDAKVTSLMERIEALENK
jgi:hypothetical protein